jgi:adenosylhomocysteine nucleosidase
MPASAARADIGLVCALPLETAPLFQRCMSVRKYTGGRFVFRGGLLDDVRIVAVENAVGPALAERATQSLIDAHRPAWIISAGLSGALRSELQHRDIVVGTGVRNSAGRSLSLNLNYPADPNRGIFSGTLLTSEHVVRSIAEKQELAATTGCLAVDMESFAVAQACSSLGERCMAVRVISDDLSADLPAEAVAIFAKNGFRRWGAVAGSLWNRPGSASDLWKLREQAIAAADSLAGFLVGLIRDLADAIDRDPEDPES